MEARRQAERGRRLDRAFNEGAAGLDAQERGFAHELTYGTTRLRGRLDYLLARHVHRGLDSLDAAALEVLRLGAYQLLYMGSVPAYAAVSQSVDQAREDVGAGVAGLVNAVLRKVDADGDGAERFPSFEREPADFLASWGSHPRWLVDRWLGRWSADSVRSLIEADNLRPSTCVVPLEMEPTDAVARLAEEGTPAEVVGEGTRCVRLGPGVSPRDVFTVLPRAIAQDPAAHLVSCYADVPKGTKVADLCAAPGGKAIAVADRPSCILAIDRSEARLRMVKENADRTRRDVGLAVADARRPPLRAVDVVLLDAPCTGTGTLARRPDARWRLKAGSVTEMAALQSEMLAAAADAVSPGGLLVYSTCTLEPEENEEQVDAFLAMRRDFTIEPTDAVPGQYLDDRGCLAVRPQDTGFDGAFAARMRRAS
ncbi:MAG: transcription antitermination factor NusB [Gemmatimonadota bacterium]